MKTEVFFKAFQKGIMVSPTALEFRLFGTDISIQWYGVIIAFGFLLAVLFGGRMAYKWKMNLDKMIDVLIGGTIGGVIGARAYFVIFHFADYKDNLLEVFQIWKGGLAIYGGLIGGLIAAFIVCKIRKLNFFNLLDLCGMSFLIGQGIGRWGNFTNQEAFGTNTNLPWGMWSEYTANAIRLAQGNLQAHGITAVAGTFTEKAYVHPTFLYESIWCLLSFGIIYLICRKWRKFSGQLILCYGVLYGTERFFVEGLRLDSLYIGAGNVRVSQLLSAVLALASLAALILLTIKYKKNPKPIDGIDYFSEANATKSKARAEEVLTDDVVVIEAESPPGDAEDETIDEEASEETLAEELPDAVKEE